MKAALPLLAGALLLAGCAVSPKAPIAPAVVTAPRPVPSRPAPAPAPLASLPPSGSWMDLPATPGDWEFAAFPFGSQAIFRSSAGAATGFSLSCNAQSRQISLLRLGGGGQPLAMRILTETASRTGLADPAGEGLAGVMLRLAASDPLLDAMALSKGRFAVETDGLPTLYLPSYAEVSRVIEDCRG